ncbi:hypothetical protein ElyMa_005350700 [Elysia marginata]|uniref:Uncharacterized protein n=1 Tax=Elysia marginata TaxID=1093978 RepID=A0AAV4EBB7_9GAST|nr:hypothetical protein ElyMa_005350700 [Elysia marginata]
MKKGVHLAFFEFYTKKAIRSFSLWHRKLIYNTKFYHILHAVEKQGRARVVRLQVSSHNMNGEVGTGNDSDPDTSELVKHLSLPHCLQVVHFFV